MAHGARRRARLCGKNRGAIARRARRHAGAADSAHAPRRCDRHRTARRRGVRCRRDGVPQRYGARAACRPLAQRTSLAVGGPVPIQPRRPAYGRRAAAAQPARMVGVELPGRRRCRRAAPGCGVLSHQQAPAAALRDPGHRHAESADRTGSFACAEGIRVFASSARRRRGGGPGRHRATAGRNGTRGTPAPGLGTAFTRTGWPPPMPSPTTSHAAKPWRRDFRRNCLSRHDAPAPSSPLTP